MKYLLSSVSFKFFLLLLVPLPLKSNGSCPGLCSGHGSCGKKDKCKCQAGYIGLSCSDRECLYGYSWGGVPYDTNLREYAECSNVGICDRKTGLCDCSPGFTGGGCRRQICKNDCSGHGICKYVGDLAKDLSPLINGRSDRKYDLFDAKMSRSCKCDPSYTGADCSKRLCAKGDDPLTNHTNYHSYEGGLHTVEVQKNEIQKLLISGINDISGSFVLKYTDQFGSQYETRPIRVENNVGTTRKLLIYADNSGSYFSGATYAQKMLNSWGSLSTPGSGTTSYYCPFDDPACQQECPFGTGYKYGDRLSITGTTTQTETIYFVTSASPCKLIVSPAPISTNIAELASIKLLSSGTGIPPLIGVGGVLQSLRQLPNRVIPDIMVTERLRSNSKKEFDIMFNHIDNAGDQLNIQCKPTGCDIDGCQPRYEGLKKSMATITLNSNSAGTYLHYMTFTVNSGTNDDTITVSNYNDFTNKLNIGDIILIEGTNFNDGRTYTINKVASNTLTVNEDVMAESNYQSGVVFLHPTRYFKSSLNGNNINQQFSVSVISGSTEHFAATAGSGFHSTARSNQIQYVDKGSLGGSNRNLKELNIISTVDTFKDVLVGDKISMTATSDSGWNSYKNIQYEIVAIETEVHIVHPLNITATADTSSFTISRDYGTCNVTEIVKGSKESAICGNRGNCNRETGICECFTGYHGSTCSTQQVLV